MKIDYSRLFAKLKEEGITQKEFIDDLNLGGGIMQNLRHNRSTTVDTIGRICEYLQCQPNDILEIVFDENYEKHKQAKKQAQIAELEAQLAKLKQS